MPQQIHSIEITEVIGKPPVRMLKAGGWVLLGVMAILITLSTVIIVPERNQFMVNLSAVNKPLFLLKQKDATFRTMSHSRLIKKGQVLATLDSFGKTEKMMAPFDGLLVNYKDLKGTGSGNDTLWMFVSHSNSYRFTGTVPFDKYNILKKNKGLKIIVNAKTENLNLTGKVFNTSAADENEVFYYSGFLAKESNEKLNKAFPGLIGLHAEIVFEDRGKSIFKQLIE